MSKKTVESPHAPKAVGPYSQAVVAGGFVFCAGQIPLDPATGQLVAGDVQAQTARVMDNLKAVLEAAGSSFEQAVKVTIYLADLADFARMNDVYAKYFTGAFPARVTIQAAGLPRGAAVEIDCIATV